MDRVGMGDMAESRRYLIEGRARPLTRVMGSHKNTAACKRRARTVLRLLARRIDLAQVVRDDGAFDPVETAGSVACGISCAHAEADAEACEGVCEGVVTKHCNSLEGVEKVEGQASTFWTAERSTSVDTPVPASAADEERETQAHTISPDVAYEHDVDAYNATQLHMRTPRAICRRLCMCGMGTCHAQVRPVHNYLQDADGSKDAPCGVINALSFHDVVHKPSKHKFRSAGSPATDTHRFASLCTGTITVGEGRTKGPNQRIGGRWKRIWVADEVHKGGETHLDQCMPVGHRSLWRTACGGLSRLDITVAAQAVLNAHSKSVNAMQIRSIMGPIGVDKARGTNNRLMGVG
ncbi:hypothetical protein FB451DRAFT_1167496 [Mycena latifolia]|nr:hypothetical protein FB451DRAFT_1167496 [Mycena latifolia]